MGHNIKAIGATATDFFIFECSSRPNAVVIQWCWNFPWSSAMKSTPFTVAFVSKALKLELRTAFGSAFLLQPAGFCGDLWRVAGCVAPYLLGLPGCISFTVSLFILRLILRSLKIENAMNERTEAGHTLVDGY